MPLAAHRRPAAHRRRRARARARTRAIVSRQVRHARAHGRINFERGRRGREPSSGAHSAPATARASCSRRRASCRRRRRRPAGAPPAARRRRPAAHAPPPPPPRLADGCDSIHGAPVACASSRCRSTASRARPSEIAAAAMCLALHTMRLPSWTPLLEQTSMYSLAELAPCVQELWQTYGKAEGANLQARARPPPRRPAAPRAPRRPLTAPSAPRSPCAGGAREVLTRASSASPPSNRRTRRRRAPSARRESLCGLSPTTTRAERGAGEGAGSGGRGRGDDEGRHQRGQASEREREWRARPRERSGAGDGVAESEGEPEVCLVGTHPRWGRK